MHIIGSKRESEARAIARMMGRGYNISGKKIRRKAEGERMKKGGSGASALAVQALCMALLGAFAAPCALFLGGRALQPALGAYLCFCCGKRGVPAILAWLPAPSCFAAAYWIIVGMAPPIGAALLCALACIAGASAGEVWLKRSKN